MRKNANVSLPGELKAQLDEVAEKEAAPVARWSVKCSATYLFTRKFRRLCVRMMSQAQAQGAFTDKDVFEQIGAPPTRVEPPLRGVRQRF